MKYMGEQKTVRPDRLIQSETNNTVANFFLTLGLFYNDLKSLLFYFSLLDDSFPGISTVKNVQDTVTDNLTGEYHGMKSHLHRILYGTFHEFFNFLSNNQSALDNHEFQEAYNTLNLDLKHRWDALVELSTCDSTDANDDFKRSLLLVRNKIAFHYDKSGIKLRNGFIQFFLKDEENKLNESAIYSIGKRMADTRFFYCDAASQRALMMQSGSDKEFELHQQKLGDLITDVNFTIMGLMKAYIAKRP